MTKLVTKKFSNHISQQVVESITEPSNTAYYVFASRHVPYANGDDVIPTPLDSVNETFVQPYDEMVFGKRVTSNDVALMAPRYNWTSNTVYAKYDHADGTLFTKQFYVVSNTGSFYNVYKCLDNNGGAYSIQEPTDTSESACSFITTSDGYKWKLMYRMPSATFTKFATQSYMPVVTSSNVAAAAVAGAIDAIFITNPGSDYISSLDGQFRADDLRDSIPDFSGNNITYRLSTDAASNTGFYVGSALYLDSGTGHGQLRKIVNYDASNRVATIDAAFTTSPSSDTTYVIAPYVTITGDGANAAAYATVTSNATVDNYIENVVIVNRGSRYTYASASITGNTGGISNTAVLSVAIPPKGGHGSDAPNELGASLACISVKFTNTENGFVSTENDFRTVGILKDPLFKNVNLTLTDEKDNFLPNEIVYQHDYYTLIGEISVTAATNVITGTATEFTPSIKAGDKVILIDPANSVQSLREVTAVTNSTSITVNSAPTFSSTSAKIALATILTQGIQAGNSSPYITLSNVEPKFVTGKRIIGATSGAWANVSSIVVSEKSYNSWLTFDNRFRLGYSAGSGTMTEDAKIFQYLPSVANADFHSANGTYLFYTNEKGSFNADPVQTVQQVGGNATFTPSSTKYTPDIVKGSGEVLYIENKNAISRSNTQTETIKIILDF